MNDKPVILCVDDEHEVLRAIERDLRARYREDYRVIRAASGEEAVDTLTKLKQRNDDVALVVSDQRMPGLEGTEVLTRTSELYSDARLVLLTAYADTGIAIRSINEVGLDRYLSKPWDPPETHLYPALDDLLEAWTSTSRQPYSGTRIIGDQWSPYCHSAKEFLARNRIPYKWQDISRDEEALALAKATNDCKSLPIIVLADGTVLENPSREELATSLGMHISAAEKAYDLIIVGGGPSGLAAAVYGASEGLSTVLVENEAIGGQAGTSSRIENYLGFPKGLSGNELASRANAQAQRLGSEILVPQAVESVAIENQYKIVRLANGTELTARAMIAGVYYGAATSDAKLYSRAAVHINGGGNSAGQAAMHLSRYAKTVSIIIRGDSLEKSMSRYLIDQIAATPNIAVLTNTVIKNAKGEQRLEKLVLENQETGNQSEEIADALFIFIGSAPNSVLLEGIVEIDEKGFVLTGLDLPQTKGRIRNWSLDRDPFHLETSVPGLFAAGDVRWGSSKRIAAAVGEGSVAVSLVHQYLSTV
jgi:thioredoxin reductase (NADPH)